MAPQTGSKRLPVPLELMGAMLLVGAGAFVGRIVWEETILTWREGPQAVGFALLHTQPLFALLGFAAYYAAHLWLLAVIVFLFWKRHRIGKRGTALVVTQALVIALAHVPGSAWTRLVVRVGIPGPGCLGFLTSATHDPPWLQSLLDRGCDPNVVSTNPTDLGLVASPLAAAAFEGNAESVKILLGHGARPNLVAGRTKTTPLMAAAYSGHAEVVALLLAAGADPGLKDDFGETALDRARKRPLEGEQPRIVDLLLRATPGATQPASGPGPGP